MPRPFPLPITVGTDICPIARIRRVTLPYEGSALRIQKAAGVGRRTQRFVSRILGEREREQLPRYATAYLEDVSREWKEIRRLDGLIGRSRRRSREEAGEMGMLKPVELGFERDGSILSSVGSEKHISTEASIEEEYALEEIARTEEDELPDLEMGGFELSELERLLDEKLNQTSLKSQRFFEFLAGRWAAKEAVIKAFESRRITYHDIMISSPPLVDGMSQKPVAMVISEEGDWDDAQVVQVSISHTEEYATAVCIVGK